MGAVNLIAVKNVSISIAAGGMCWQQLRDNARQERITESTYIFDSRKTKLFTTGAYNGPASRLHLLIAPSEYCGNGPTGNRHGVPRAGISTLVLE